MKRLHTCYFLLFFIPGMLFSQSNIEYKAFDIDDYKLISTQIQRNEEIKTFANKQLKTDNFGIEVSSLLSNLCWNHDFLFSIEFLENSDCSEDEGLDFERRNSLQKLSVQGKNNLLVQFSKITKDGFLVAEISKKERKNSMISWPDVLTLFLQLDGTEVRIIEKSELMIN